MGNVVHMWTSQRAAAQQIVGRKAMAPKSMMEKLPEGAMPALTAVVSELGWEDSPWTDGVLASKRNHPGYVLRAAESKRWSARQTVSPSSLVLMVERLARGVATASGAG